ncbi:MAG: Bug family tripartite tricarboxylate transporter substrate binding protein [Xanthobacteraceae bacterium]
MKRPFAAVLAALSLTLLSVPAAAQEWPTKPVRIIVPFSPGGAADTPARLYAEALSQAFGKQFIVENRPGGGGIPVAEQMARTEPDGYTLMVSGIPVIVVGPAMRAKVNYDPMRDLAHIGYFGGTANLLTVHETLGINTYKDFIAYARKQSGGVDYASAGLGTMGNWNAEYVAALEKIKFNHIAYKGGARAIIDVLAARVKVAVLTWTAVGPHIQSGKLKGLAVTSAKRLSSVPQVPTFRELGHKDFVSVTWFSLSGPAKMPKNIVNRLNAEIIKASNRPEIKSRNERESIDPTPMSPAELAKFAQSEIDRWAPLIRRIMAQQKKTK